MTNSSVFLAYFWVLRHLQRFRRIFLQRWCFMTRLRIYFLRQSLSPFFSTDRHPTVSRVSAPYSRMSIPLWSVPLCIATDERKGKKEGNLSTKKTTLRHFTKKNTLTLAPSKKGYRYYMLRVQ